MRVYLLKLINILKYLIIYEQQEVSFKPNLIIYVHENSSHIIHVFSTAPETREKSIWRWAARKQNFSCYYFRTCESNV